VADPGHALATIAQLRAVGVRVALDGYGTGHLSMSCLRQMGFDTLKLNRVYVRDLEQPGGDAILRGIIDMAHALNSDVTAKGVARGSQLRTLRALGCDAAQGPLRAAPSDATEIGRHVVSPRRAAAERPGTRAPLGVPSGVA
jgi:EAL domain-containing protein (putative c-di-GMP-specific phosphodiesterase class I)